MSPPAGTIDLGELPRGEQPEIAVGWPAARRIKRWRGRPAWRIAGAAATTGLVIAVTGAAGAPPPPPLTLQFAVQATDYNVVYDEQRLYVFTDASTSEQTTVTAHRLEDGTVAWQAPVPGERSWLSLWAGALLVVTYPNDPHADWPTDQTTRLDRDSGEPLWTRDGWPAGDLGDRLLFSQSVPGTSGDEYPQTKLSVVDIATGNQAWSIDADRWAYDRRKEPATLVTLDRESMLASYDLATGELLATAPTTAPTDPDQPSYYWTLRTFGSLAFVLEEIAGEMALSAYDVAALQRLWTLAGVVAEHGDELAAWPVPCGEFVCLTGYRDVPQAIDPHTGQTVWSADWLLLNTGEASYDVFDLSPAQLPGYAVLSSDSPRTSEAGSWLIDVATGERVLDLQQWRLVSGYLPQQATTSPAATVVTRTGEAGTWIGRLRPDLSGIDAVGLIESATSSDDGFSSYCGPTAELVVCFIDVVSNSEVSRTDVEVWRLRG